MRQTHPSILNIWTETTSEEQFLLLCLTANHTYLMPPSENSNFASLNLHFFRYFLNFYSHTSWRKQETLLRIGPALHLKEQKKKKTYIMPAVSAFKLASFSGDWQRRTRPYVRYRVLHCVPACQDTIMACFSQKVRISAGKPQWALL